MKTYAQAINEALRIAEEVNPTVFVMGEGVDDPKGVFGTTKNLPRNYDMPLCEEGFTGFAIGTALMDMRPVIVHARVDFMLVAMNQLVNMAAKIHHSSGGKQRVPIVVRAIIGKGWGQGSQHSQSLLSTFAHIPGLKVVAPSNAYDAKGMLLHAIFEEIDPVIFIEHRRLYDLEDEVPDGYYTVRPGTRVVQQGETKTIVATSYMVPLACHEEPDVEVIDISSLRPIFGTELIFNSYERTGQITICEPDWATCGISAEIAAQIAQKYLRVRRLGIADCPAPTSWKLEEEYYRTRGLPGECIPGKMEGPF